MRELRSRIGNPPQDRSLRDLPVWQVDLVHTDDSEVLLSHLLSDITLQAFKEDAKSGTKVAIKLKDAVSSITEIKSLRQSN